MRGTDDGDCILDFCGGEGIEWMRSGGLGGEVGAELLEAGSHCECLNPLEDEKGLEKLKWEREPEGYRGEGNWTCDRGTAGL